jgi:hypothetical protein
MNNPQDNPRSPMPFYLSILILAAIIFLGVMYMPLDQVAIDADREMRVNKISGDFAGITGWVARWMSFQHFIFAGSLLFIVWHNEARVYLLGIIVSHAMSFAEIAFAPFERLGLGLVSLNHLVWIPALILMLMQWPKLAKNSPYGIWYHLALFQLSFSLFFDIRDSVYYLF